MTVRYVDWPNKKCPFPYLTSAQARDLGECMKPLQDELYDSETTMESFPGRVSSEHQVGVHLGEYFNNNDINSPSEAWQSLKRKLSDDDGYTLCSLGHLIDKHKNKMTIERFLELVDARDEMKDKMKITVYRQGRVLCVTKLEAPLVELALQEFLEKPKPETVRYAVLPSGTPTASVNDELIPRLGITGPQLQVILSANPDLRTKVRMSEGSGRKRVVDRTDVEDFMTAVQNTREYQECRAKSRAKRTYAHQKKT